MLEDHQIEGGGNTRAGEPAPQTAGNLGRRCRSSVKTEPHRHEETPMRYRLASYAAPFADVIAAVAIWAPGAQAATPTCHGHAATIVGTAAGDTLVGTPGPDVIVGLGGNDQIAGRGGNDIVCGGAGADVLRGGRGSD